MPRRTIEKPLGYEPYPDLAKSQMHDLVLALNGTKPRISRAGYSGKPRTIRLPRVESQKELRRLVQTWMDSGPDLIEMFKKEPKLELLIRYGKTRFYPMHDGRGHLDWIPEIDNEGLSSHKKQALQDFMILITNPLWRLLAGPCVRCEDYFLKKTKRQKIYCSRDCGSEVTAIAAVRRRRQEAHDNKIRRAKDAIDEWSKAKRRLSWKAWVVNHTGYTVRWITRAVNNGALRPPTPDGQR